MATANPYDTLVEISEEDYCNQMMQNPLGRKWFIWHRENPAFFELFEQFTKEAIRAGHTQLSGWLIINRVRWETDVVTTGDKYKISNNYVALFARLFMIKYPEYIGFFTTKKMSSIPEDVFNPV